jgi:DNA-binding winged helix-turn-helix (wHTH) protein
MSAAPTGPERSCVYRFGPFEFFPHSGELRRNHRLVRSQQQPLKILEVLVEHAGELVSREMLQRELWPGDTFVDFDMGLNTAVRKLRLCLGDDADRPRYIETLSRRGYRFIAAVTAVDAMAPAAMRIAEAAPRPDAAPAPLPFPPSASREESSGQSGAPLLPQQEAAAEEIDWDFWVSMANPPAPAQTEPSQESAAPQGYSKHWVAALIVAGVVLLLLGVLIGARLHALPACILPA